MAERRHTAPHSGADGRLGAHGARSTSASPHTVESVLILVLVVNALALRKLADRGITSAEVEQVVANGPLVVPNPNARLAGSVFAIGITDGARFLTIVLQPDEASPTRWHVMTGWDSSPRQIEAFQSRR